MSEKSVELSASDIRRVELWQGALPETVREKGVTATRASQVEDAADAAGNALRTIMRASTRDGGARRIDAANAPLLTDTVPGRSFLRASSSGRAIAIGAPATACPAMGVALTAKSLDAAASTALKQCLNATNPPHKLRGRRRVACGCRLIALGSVLIAEQEAFTHARKVSALIIDPRSGARAPLVAAVAPVGPDLDKSASADAAQLTVRLAGAQEIDLSSATAPIGRLSLSAGGAAELRLKKGGPSYRGKWRVEGFRRGRRAGVVSLARGPKDRLFLLIGYEPGEVAKRGRSLIAAARRLR